MAQASRIEWTESTWNPVVGCRKVSEGCRHCYAERMAKRLAAIARAGKRDGRAVGRTANYLQIVDRRGRWNGEVYLDDGAVGAPLRWRTGRTIFVNSMSDLFHEDVPLEFVQRVFATMNEAAQHTFQILTKRPARAEEFSPQLDWTPNIGMGTSVEDARVVNRIRELRKTGARTKFLSVEPLIGPIPRLPLTGIDWVIVGGESGPGARPMRESWVRNIRDRCVSRGVPFFFKQWGGVNKKAAGRSLGERTWDEMPRLATATG